MADFPTLSSKPDSENWTEEPAVDPTIRSEFENGAVQTRTRFTDVPKKWDLIYRDMSQADKDTLKAFEKTVGYGGDIFNWTNPQDTNTYEVRFAGPVKCKVEPVNPAAWQVPYTSRTRQADLPPVSSAV